MRKLMALLVLLVCGCSTTPLADVLDLINPGHLGTPKVQPYGGVCLPQGAVTGTVGGPLVPAPPAPVISVSPPVPAPPPPAPPGPASTPTIVVPPPAGVAPAPPPPASPFGRTASAPPRFPG